MVTEKYINHECIYEDDAIKLADLSENAFFYHLMKRALDIVLSLLGLIVLSPVFLVIAICIKLESKGPVFYLHSRVGKNGTPLKLYKFRSMYLNADQMIKDFTPEQMAEWKENFKLKNDPRITRIGKFLRRSSLDELPQLLNILQGNLTIVGPRPVVKEELEKYGELQDYFLSVTPGLTGYWQAYSRSDCSYEERMKMELHYIANANLLWDIRIMFKTVSAVLKCRGAH